MKNWKYILLSVILFPLVGMVSSCSEDTEAEGEFDNWQEKNEKVLDQWAANSSYRKILTFSKDESTTMSFKNTDFIYVEVLESGDGTETPLYTDTCRVAYRGHYIPTVSYPEGLVFDQNYLDDFSWMTAGTSKFVAGALVNGFSTALMHMHVGDRWRVRIPYMLGYGKSDYSSGSNTIPGYSNLVFEIALYDFWHPGEYRSNFKSR
jgi:FKBP-type peptidyl-prolyl cis-trans isomerase FklB